MKGQSEEEKSRILAIAGNPHNGRVEQLYSIPGAYRILVRTYPYNKAKKRGGEVKKAIGVVINDQFLTNEEYHLKYTRHGRLRPLLPAEPNRRRGRPGKLDTSGAATQSKAGGSVAAVLPEPPLSSGNNSGNNEAPAESQATSTTAAEGTTAAPAAPQTTQPADGPAPAAPRNDPAPELSGTSSTSSNAVRPTEPVRLARPDPCVYQRLVGPVPILYQTAVNCGIEEDLQIAFGNQTVVNEILSLAFHWLIDEDDEDNVAARYPDFSQAYALPHLGRLEESELAQLYSSLGNCEAQLSKLFSLRLRRLPGKARVSYDSTSIPTTASDIRYSQASLSKDGIIETMQHLSLLVDHDTHQPLMYRLYGGATPDCRTMEGLLNHLKEYGASEDITAVLDRGYETIDNLLAAKTLNYRCLMAVCHLDQKEFAQAIEICATDLREPDTCIPGVSHVHGRTKKITVRVSGIDLPLWIHVYLDTDKFSNEEAAFMRRLDEFDEIWSKTDPEDRGVLYSDRRMRFYNLPQKRDKTLKRDRDLVSLQTRFCGLFASVSNCEMSCREAYEIYRQRDCIEKCFKSGKMELGLNTAHAHHHDTMEGRCVVAFTALTILSALNYQLGMAREPADGCRKKLRAHAFSWRKILDKLRSATISYAVTTRKLWYECVPLSKIGLICQACGIDNVYEKVPAYIVNPLDLRRNSSTARRTVVQQSIVC